MSCSFSISMHTLNIQNEKYLITHIMLKDVTYIRGLTKTDTYLTWICICNQWETNIEQTKKTGNEVAILKAKCSKIY